MTSKKTAKNTKPLFLFFNAVFFVSGLMLFSVGVWSLCELGPYEALSPTVPFAAASKLIITAGIFNVLVSFFGYWAASKKNSHLFILFFLVLLMVLGLEISAAAVGYQSRDKIRETLPDDVRHVIREVFGIKTAPSNAIRDMQRKGECCGWNNFTDWRDSWFSKGNDSIVPNSCCKEPKSRYQCGRNFTRDSISTKGCKGVVLWEFTRPKLFVVAVTAVTATVIQVLGMLFVLVFIFNREQPGEQLPLCVRTPCI